MKTRLSLYRNWHGDFSVKDGPSSVLCWFCRRGIRKWFPDISLARRKILDVGITDKRPHDSEWLKLELCVDEVGNGIYMLRSPRLRSSQRLLISAGQFFYAFLKRFGADLTKPVWVRIYEN